MDAAPQVPNPRRNNTSDIQATVAAPAQKSMKRKHPMNFEVMKKSDTVLDQFSAMERWLQQQERRDDAFSVLSAPSAHSSPKQSTNDWNTSRSLSHGPANPPSIDFLRNGSDIQAQVDKRL